MKIRDKPLDKEIERLNLMLMKLQNERRIKARAWDQRGLVPRALMHIKKLKTHYGEYDFEGEDDDGFVSIGTNGGRWKLNLLTHTCECNEWQLSGLPCIHAASVIIPMRLEWEGVLRNRSKMGFDAPPQTVRSTYSPKIGGSPRGSRPKPQAKFVPCNPHMNDVSQVTESQTRGSQNRGRASSNGSGRGNGIIQEGETLDVCTGRGRGSSRSNGRGNDIVQEDEALGVRTGRGRGSGSDKGRGNGRLNALTPSQARFVENWLTTHPNNARKRTSTQPLTQASQTASATVNPTPPNPTRTKENPYKKVFNPYRQPWKH
ncbi:hypothetical protein GIB67_026772 [Kingdonia uniflora]|uniref:SWIM-type domain-containing protein n=1 Tax=Kingdonia uniflora TaxID=39325 RepID=A0A7J7MHE7_9MAGN|nr:hypothetical protein GIB67_026772 [Kingdonia uniflora]